MKKLILVISVIASLSAASQTYQSYKINLLSLIHPNNGSIGIGPDDRRYSGCWGWFQEGDSTELNKEYAISGSSSGTYFIDVTNPSTPSVSAFVPGKPGCTWREVKTYKNYCYVVSDDAAPNTFQIIDMSTLPSTVTVVHNGTTYFERGHTIWIDNDKMYIGSTTYPGGAGFSSMNVYSLATPTAPVLLRSLNQDAPFINHVHDMFVRNDTIFASCGYQGLFIFRYNSSSNVFEQLGSFTNYSGGSYNHSSFLTADGKHLVFADEVPAGQPLRLVDVQNLSNIQLLQSWLPNPQTTPHNPYLIGDKWAVVSCYVDGLYIYDISQPNNIHTAGFFDTHPQAGANTGNYSGGTYRGNWGAYPYLPSGIIIANDMQNGVFILDAIPAFNNPVSNRSHAKELNIFAYPNPASDILVVNTGSTERGIITISNILGQTVFSSDHNTSAMEINVRDVAEGSYIVSFKTDQSTVNKKVIITH